MEKIWKLLQGIFLLLAGAALVLVGMMFEGTAIAVVGVYGGLICILAGLIVGFTVMFKKE